MRSDTNKRLDRLLLLQKLKMAATALSLLVLAGALFWFAGLDGQVETRAIAGTVAKVEPAVGKGLQAGASDVDVVIDGGRHVHVLTAKEHTPHVGERVTITAHVHGSGRTTYSWK